MLAVSCTWQRRAELSKGVKRHARASGISLVLNLEQVLDSLYAQASRLPACSRRMQVADLKLLQEEV